MITIEENPTDLVSVVAQISLRPECLCWFSQEKLCVLNSSKIGYEFLSHFTYPPN